MTIEKRIQILCDNATPENPNLLTMLIDEQGDIYMNVIEQSGNDSGVRITTSGSRYRGESGVRLRKALVEVMAAYEEVLNDEFCHPALHDANSKPQVRPRRKDG